MVNHVVLNNVDHRDLRVHTGFGAEYGDAVMCTLAIPAEFRNLVADYPIFMHRDPDTSKFLPMVMFGFKEGENLFLEGDQWQASYVPLMIRRGPFLIGFQRGVGGGGEREMVISMDLDSPRFGAEGEPLFDPFGGNSVYTDKIVDILQLIDQGQSVIDDFSTSLERHELLEPFSLDIRLDSGKQRRLEGFYTIHEEKLAALDGDTLADFSRRGILHASFMVLASMANIPRLIKLKNQRGE